MREVAIIARKYIGQQEIAGNHGFKDKDFNKRMGDVGFQTGQAWCAYFTEMVWKEAYPDKSIELNKLFSAGAVSTWNNFKKNKGYTCDYVPESGAIVIWQYYKSGEPHWTGHAGIVDYISGNNIITIEGNTNSEGGREGIEVAEKKRGLDFSIKENGLVLLGFIKIK